MCTKEIELISWESEVKPEWQGKLYEDCNTTSCLGNQRLLQRRPPVYKPSSSSPGSPEDIEIEGSNDIKTLREVVF
jgi:hypothetical protein